MDEKETEIIISVNEENARRIAEMIPCGVMHDLIIKNLENSPFSLASRIRDLLETVYA